MARVIVCWLFNFRHRAFVMSSKTHTAASGPSASHPWKGAAVGLLMLAGAGGLLYKVNDATVEAPVIPAPAIDTAEAERAALEARLAKFFDEDARPLLTQTKGKDLAAIARVLNGVDASFARYAAGVPKFAKELTGWGTRFKIMMRKSVETLEGKEQHTWTQQVIQEKFTQNVMSDASLEKDLSDVMRQFAFDLQANRNEMLAGVETKLAASNLPVSLKQVALKDFKIQFDSNLAALLKKMPMQSVGIGVGSLTAGIIAQEAVTQIVRTVLAEMAVRLATSAAAAGGAASGAASAGAAGGSAIAPGVGTVVGLAGGFIVGAFVDWWMTDKFEEEVAKQCRGFLDTTKASLLDGESGIKKMLTTQVEQSAAFYEEAVQSSLHSPPKIPIQP